MYNRRLKRGLLIACASVSLAGAVFLATINRRVSAQSSGGTAGDWITYNGNYSGDRFSALQEITIANVTRVDQVCMFDTGETTSFQTGPLAEIGRAHV